MFINIHKQNKFEENNSLQEENLIDYLKNMLHYKRVFNVEPPYTICEQIQSVVSVCELHKKTFEDLRHKYYGKEVVICATGPSLDYYKPIKNAIHIGVNMAFKSSKIKFDNLFLTDPNIFGGKLPSEFIKYRDKKCTKFLGYGTPLSLDINPKKYDIRYFSTENKFNYLINYLPLPDFTSVVFSAVGYALWTTPKKIYIVGADCSEGHASSLKINYSSNLSRLIEYWKELKNFASWYYPDIEIISVNPVGLKGLFKDVYTENYINSSDLLKKERTNLDIIKL